MFPQLPLSGNGEPQPMGAANGRTMDAQINKAPGVLPGINPGKPYPARRPLIFHPVLGSLISVEVKITYIKSGDSMGMYPKAQ